MDIDELKDFKCINSMSEEGYKVWKGLVNAYRHVLNDGPLIRKIGFTPHDFDNHCVNIYKIISHVLMKDEQHKLHPEEWFILNVAVLFHDISMARKSTAEERNIHSEKSADYVRDSYVKQHNLWNGIKPNIKDVIPLVIQAHSDTRNSDGTKIKNLENVDLTNDMPGRFASRIRGKYLAAILRLADELDITRERLGEHDLTTLNLDEDDPSEKESLQHWKRLYYFKSVRTNATRIELVTNDEYIKQCNDDESVLNEIKDIKKRLLEQLQYINETVFYNMNEGIKYQDIVLVSSEYVDEEQINSNITKIKHETKHTTKKQTQIDSSQEAINESMIYDEEEKPKNKVRCGKLEIELVSLELSKKISNYVIGNKLTAPGHFRMNQYYCGKDWIDIRPMITSRELGLDIIKCIVRDIEQHISSSMLKETIIVGISMNGNILASRVAFDMHLPFTYILSSVSGKKGSPLEKEVDLTQYKNIIILTGVISTYATIKDVLDKYHIHEKTSYIYTVLYRKMEGIERHEEGIDEIAPKIRALNAEFYTEIIKKRECMLEKYGKCIAENILSFDMEYDEQGHRKNYLRLAYGDSQRVFLNTTIGCETKCRYCYVDKLKQSGRVFRYEALDVLAHLEVMEEIIYGKDGTIFSLGCYSECLEKQSKEETYKLISHLIPYGNPIQISTKKRLDFNEIKAIDDKLLYKGQLTIYISIPTISQADVYEKNADKIKDRIHNFELAEKLEKCNIVMYIKPVLGHDVTIKDVDEYKRLIQQYKIPCVVGNYLEISDDRLDDTKVGEGYLEEKESTVADQLRKELSKVGNVYRHSIDVIKR